MPRPGSIRRSVTRVVFMTTLVALLINAAVLVALDVDEYRDSELAAIQVQADMLARASAAAIAFVDEEEAGNAIRLLARNPQIHAAGVYLGDGRLFASYARSAGDSVPERADTTDMLGFAGDRIRGFHTAAEKDGPVSTVYVSAHSRFYDRLLRYLGILAMVTGGVLVFAFVLSQSLQRAVTAPILVVADAARRVVERHDYSVRVDRQSGYEAGLLADAFNHMLAEIEKRAAALREEMREREQAENALREADAKKDRFLAVLAHELRNPLAPIVTCVQVLRRTGGSDLAERRAHEVIDRQLGHMTRLLDDLLDVSRITNDRFVLQRSPIALASVVDAALESSRPGIERAGHIVEVALPDEPLYVDADLVRLAQVFTNLLNNAAKYTHAGGHIRFAAKRSGDWVEVTVEDDGVGIEAEDLPRIFDIFAQSDPRRDRAAGGLGIGLFLVKSLTEMHGGTISAASAGKGAGSRFTVRLPLVPSPVQEVSVTPSPVARHAVRRILVADDNRDAAEALASMLRLLGHEVVLAYDGRQALEAAQHHLPDAALIDIGMPKLDGYQVARQLRAMEGGSSMLLVAVTGWGSDDDKRRAAEAGFDHHLTKPARLEDIEDLFAAAASVLRRTG